MTRSLTGPTFHRSLPSRGPFMNADLINAHLKRAREILGDRTVTEIAYDDSVVAHLTSGMDIKRAVRAANREHPGEALKPRADHWDALASRYEFIREHKSILKRLGLRE